MAMSQNFLLPSVTRREFGGFAGMVAVCSVFGAGAGAGATTTVAPSSPSYHAVGVGGGGAMTGLSMSPYSDVWFIATDMGTLFRSPDYGATWYPVAHDQAIYPSKLELATPIGFLPDGQTMFHAFSSVKACDYDTCKSGLRPCRSVDAGITWRPLSGFPESDVVKYWVTDDRQPDLVFAATASGLLRSDSKGDRWESVAGISGLAKGTFVDSHGGDHRIYHATVGGIHVSNDGGKSFYLYHQAAIAGFAGGRDSEHLTLTYVGAEPDPGPYVFISTDLGEFKKAKRIEEDGTIVDQIGGDHIAMAANDSQTIYVTGNGNWPGPGAMGTKVWVARNGKDFGPHVFLQRNEKDEPWPEKSLEHSAIGIEIGWNDGSYHSFAVHPRNSSIAGGTGNYFFHLTRDHGDTWKSPFTSHVGTGTPKKGARWKTTGLEVASIRYLKFHPNLPDVGYACGCDHHALSTMDGGETWGLSKPPYNSVYDIAFDLKNNDIMYAAINNRHDWAHTGNTGILCFVDGRGSGIFRKTQNDQPWELFGEHPDLMYSSSFILVSYDSDRRILYAGTQGAGIFRRIDDGPWERIVKGLGDSPHIVPQIEVDQRDGTTYALLTGNIGAAHGGSGSINQTGIYVLYPGSNEWKSLRGLIAQPKPNQPNKNLWSYPTYFAVDWNSSGEKLTIYMVDADRNSQYEATGLWRTRDSGRNWEFLLQHTHAMHVLIDTVDRRRIYVTGGESMDSRWGTVACGPMRMAGHGRIQMFPCNPMDGQ